MWSSNALREEPLVYKGSDYPPSLATDSSHLDPIFCCDPACLQLCSLDCPSSCTQDTTTPCTIADCQHDCSDPFCTTYDPCIDDCLSDCSDHCIVDCDDNCSEICTADCTEPSCKELHCTQSQCTDTPCSSYNSSHTSLDHKMDPYQQTNPGNLFQVPPHFDFSAMSQAEANLDFHLANYQANNMSMSQDIPQATIPAYNQAMSQAIQQSSNEAVNSVEPQTNQLANQQRYKPCGCSDLGENGTCGFVYTSPKNAREHYDQAHLPYLVVSYVDGKNLKKFKCPWPNCGHSSPKAQMYRHFIAHGYPKEHECEYCGKAHGTAQQLENHERTHTGDKPKKCEHCDYAAATQHLLKEHIETEHKGESHQCLSCGQAIAGRTNFNHHVATFHAKGVKCPNTRCTARNRCSYKMWAHFLMQREAGEHDCGTDLLDDDESFRNWWELAEEAVKTLDPTYEAWVVKMEGKSRTKAVKNKVRTEEKKRKASAEVDNGAASRKRARPAEDEDASGAAKAKKRNLATRKIKEVSRRDPNPRVRQVISSSPSMEASEQASEE